MLVNYGEGLQVPDVTKNIKTLFVIWMGAKERSTPPPQILVFLIRSQIGQSRHPINGQQVSVH
jgi:hypothetical protein